MARTLLPAVGCALVFGILASPAQAAKTFTESFTTTTYKDAAQTTANWNTGAGQLQLFPFAVSEVGNYDTPGVNLSLAIFGNLAYVGDAGNGLRVLNIADPSNPVLVGTASPAFSCYDIAVSGHLVVVADGGGGVRIVDTSNPATPVVVGTYASTDARGVAILEKRVLVADNAAGLRVVDITNPASPALLGTYDTPGAAMAVTTSGLRAFVADGGAGLQIINVGNPASPTLVGTYDTPGSALGVAVDGFTAYIADGTSGLVTVNIQNQTTPTLRGSYDTPGNAEGVFVTGDRAYVADGATGLLLIDITNPASPSLMLTQDTPGTAHKVVVDGPHAFVADHGRFRAVEVARPTGLPLGGYGAPAQGVFFNDIALSGDLLVAAGAVLDPYWYFAAGVYILDIGNPASLTDVGVYFPGGSVEHVAMASNQIAVISVFNPGGEIRVLGITNPAAPTLFGSYSTAVNDIEAVGRLVFVAAGAEGLKILDISNPASPSLLGSYAALDARDVAVMGNLAAVADGPYGLKLVNISNPASPVLAGTYSTGANNVELAGDAAFISGPSALTIVDILNPASPALIGSYPVAASDVVVTGNLAFVRLTGGLDIVDITNLAAPTRVGLIPKSVVYRAAVAGDIAFISSFVGVEALSVLQREVDFFKNSGRSVAVDATSGVIRKVRLNATQSAGVDWEVSANNGAAWQPFTADNTWTNVLTPGTDLMWRSTLTWTPGASSTVSDLKLDWLFNEASIEAIADLPNDQGGWLRVTLERSMFDFTTELATPITNYGVWRRIDDVALIATIRATSRVTDDMDPAVTQVFGGLPLVVQEGRVFAQSSSLPPGMWELVQNVPALQSQSYTVSVPTAADQTISETNPTVLIITAHTATPSVWYTSEPDSGSSIDNIAPGVPANFAVAYNTGHGNTLSWGVSPDEDFQYFRVYRSTNPNFVPSAGTLVHSTVANGWSDPAFDGWSVYYKVTALDYVGNESAPTGSGTLTGVVDPAPREFALYPNVPNPFNPTTRIRYDVPHGGGKVSLRIYDVSGRVVRTLLEGAQSAGEKWVDWDGHDDAGRPAATGVYFCRFTAPGYIKTHKMVLMK